MRRRDPRLRRADDRRLLPAVLPNTLRASHERQFFASCAAASTAGLRACKRCRPDSAPPRAAQTQAIAAAGLSRFHFHRVFKACTGVTPKAYAAQAGANCLRREFARGTSVAVACYEAGFNSSSSFYPAARGALGMQPREYRRDGAALAIQYTLRMTSLGRILVAASAQRLCAILFGDADDALLVDLRARLPRVLLSAAAPDFAATVAAVARLIETPARGLHLSLDIRGTAFQQRVWRALRELPTGATISYREFAARIDAPAASRAVAQACGANPLAVAVPCPRVVRSLANSPAIAEALRASAGCWPARRATTGRPEHAGRSLQPSGPCPARRRCAGADAGRAGI